MFIKRLIKIIKNSGRLAKELSVSKECGMNVCFLFFDILLSVLLYGANVEDYKALRFYDKSFHCRNKYVTAYRNFVKFKKAFDNPSKIDIFDNKEKFAEYFSKFQKHESIATNKAEWTDIEGFIKKHKSVIVKPYGGCEGIGVFRLSFEDTEGINQLRQRINSGERFMVEQLIHQHPLIAKLNPDSVNTIRVETCVDSKGDVHIVNTVIIIGTSKACVNNTHNGGIMCHIDTDLGIIDSKGGNPKSDVYTIHPATGEVLLGYKIPNWKGVLDFSKELAKVVPDVRLIGWDVVILEDGYDVIEGNVNPGHVTQVTDGVGRYKLLKSYI